MDRAGKPRVSARLDKWALVRPWHEKSTARKRAAKSPHVRHFSDNDDGREDRRFFIRSLQTESEHSGDF
jgi:hypothetical protein